MFSRFDCTAAAQQVDRRYFNTFVGSCSLALLYTRSGMDLDFVHGPHLGHHDGHVLASRAEILE